MSDNIGNGKFTLPIDISEPYIPYARKSSTPVISCSLSLTNSSVRRLKELYSSDTLSYTDIINLSVNVLNIESSRVEQRLGNLVSKVSSEWRRKRRYQGETARKKYLESTTKVHIYPNEL